MNLNLPWNTIETVLLDLDGTLLDLHFDNHFWMEHVPKRYAQRHHLSYEAAHAEVTERCKRVEGTLDWYCLDYWSRELDLDIPLLKEEVDHLIAVHPHVVAFLDACRNRSKRVVLVTNAHRKALALKMDRTQLQGHFDRIISAHDLGHAKESQTFWDRLHEREPFDAEHTLFVDDSLSVLRSAQQWGIGHVIAITQPDTRQPARDVHEFMAIADFSEIMAGL